jgi:hypothetical protein
MSPLPNLVIAGVGKAGTTSLYWYLSQHPDVCASTTKEIRFFVPAATGEALPALEGYERHFAHCGDQRYRLEASPQYFHGGRAVAEAMRRVLGEARVIVMLRDPVERVWSTFRFMRSRLAGLPDDLTFDDYVERCLRVRARREPLTTDNLRYWTVQGGVYVEHLDPWVEVFADDLRIVFSERLAASPPGVVRELCGWLGIDQAAADRISYTVENRTIAYRSAWLQRLALAVNSERFLGRRRRLKEPLRRLYHAVNRRSEASMPQEARRRLEEVFAPANEALAARLRDLGYEDLPGWLERP